MHKSKSMSRRRAGKPADIVRVNESTLPNQTPCDRRVRRYKPDRTSKSRAIDRCPLAGETEQVYAELDQPSENQEAVIAHVERWTA